MIFRLFIFFAGIAIGTFSFLPLPFSGGNLSNAQSIRYFDINHQVFFEDFSDTSGYHESIALKDIPSFVQNATVLLEDKRFFFHPGFDPLAIIRAIFQNIKSGSIVSGGSGITQQLIRNHLRVKQRNKIYKLHELLLAIKTDFLFSKNEILEAYLNSVYYGENAYGIAAAAQIFFNKTPNELNLHEAIFLAGLPQSPSAYNPFKKMTNALKREKTVIQILEHNGFFKNYCQDKQCLATPLKLERGKKQKIAPHYIEETKKELAKIIPDTTQHQIEVNTYFDQGLFASAQSVIEKQITELEEKNVRNAAVVILNHQERGVSVLIGSKDYFDTKIQGFVNNAVAFRQAGSTMKPFTYALAFEHDDTPNSLVDDSFLHLQTQDGLPYEPKNYDFEEYGKVTYRQALANSYNISAIKVAQKVGVENLLNTFRALGFRLNEGVDHYGLALTLGDGEIRLLDLANAYTVFPLEGKKYPFRFIKSVRVDGKIIYERPPETGEKIFSSQSTRYIEDILSDNEARSQQFGLDSPLRTSVWSAAKTGTTKNYRDNWTMGFTREYTVGVWVGNSDGSYLKNSSGITGAAPIWHDIIEALPKNQTTTIIKNQLPSNSASKQTRKHSNIFNDQSLIISPQNGDVFLLEGNAQEAVIFKAKKNVEWKLDGKNFGNGQKKFWENPTVGKHCAEALFEEVKEKSCFTIIH